MRGMNAAKIREMEFASREIAKTLERAFLSFQKIGGCEKWGFALMIFISGKDLLKFFGKVILLAAFLILASYGLVIAAAMWFKVW